jgi:hypothetical protein
VAQVRDCPANRIGAQGFRHRLVLSGLGNGLSVSRKPARSSLLRSCQRRSGLHLVPVHHHPRHILEHEFIRRQNISTLLKQLIRGQRHAVRRKPSPNHRPNPKLESICRLQSPAPEHPIRDDKRNGLRCDWSSDNSRHSLPWKVSRHTPLPIPDMVIQRFHSSSAKCSWQGHTATSKISHEGRRDAGHPHPAYAALQACSAAVVLDVADRFLGSLHSRCRALQGPVAAAVVGRLARVRHSHHFRTSFWCSCGDCKPGQFLIHKTLKPRPNS